MLSFAYPSVSYFFEPTLTSKGENYTADSLCYEDTQLWPWGLSTNSLLNTLMLYTINTGLLAEYLLRLHSNVLGSSDADLRICTTALLVLVSRRPVFIGK
jgi:hypothetical protein